MNRHKKYGKDTVVEVIVLLVIIILGLFVLFIDVFAAEGIFGEGFKWTWIDSRLAKRIYIMVCGAILCLLTSFRKKRK